MPSLSAQWKSIFPYSYSPCLKFSIIFSCPMCSLVTILIQQLSLQEAQRCHDAPCVQTKHPSEASCTLHSCTRVQLVIHDHRPAQYVELLLSITLEYVLSIRHRKERSQRGRACISLGVFVCVCASNQLVTGPPCKQLQHWLIRHIVTAAAVVVIAVHW